MNVLARTWHKPRGLVVDVGLALLYLLVLFWAGLVPLKHLPGPEFEWVDKVWHLVAFAGLAGLGARALRHWGRPVASANLAAAVASATLGGLLELLQSLTRYRSAELADFLADVLGALIAYAVLRSLARAAPA